MKKSRNFLRITIFILLVLSNLLFIGTTLLFCYLLDSKYDNEDMGAAKIEEYRYFLSLLEEDEDKLKIMLKHYVESADKLGSSPTFDQLIEAYKKEEYPKREGYFYQIIQGLAIFRNPPSPNKHKRSDIINFFGEPDGVYTPPPNIPKYYKDKTIEYYDYEFCKEQYRALIILNANNEVEHVFMNGLPFPPFPWERQK